MKRVVIGAIPDPGPPVGAVDGGGRPGPALFLDRDALALPGVKKRTTAVSLQRGGDPAPRLRQRLRLPARAAARPVGCSFSTSICSTSTGPTCTRAANASQGDACCAARTMASNRSSTSRRPTAVPCSRTQQSSTSKESCRSGSARRTAPADPGIGSRSRTRWRTQYRRKIGHKDCRSCLSEA